MVHPDDRLLNNIITALKRNELSAMKRRGGTFSAHDYVKEASLKRLHTVCFQLYEILEKVKLGSQ